MKNILCFGDSNTYGLNPKTFQRFDRDTRWTALVQKQLGNTFHIIEEGLCGRTTVHSDDYLPDCSGTKLLPFCIRSHEPIDLAIIMLGTNDLNIGFNPSERTFRNGLEAIIKILKNPYTWSSHIVPKILIVSPIHISSDIANGMFNDIFNDTSIMLSKQLSAICQELCKSYELFFLDAAAFAEPSVTDGIHLDEAGHKALSLGITSKILDIL